MRIIILTGERGKLLDKIIPRSFWTSNTRISISRLKWIIGLMEKDSGRKIDELC